MTAGSPSHTPSLSYLAYCILAGLLQVNLVFAAFLAGFAVVHKKRRLFADALDAIGKVSNSLSSYQSISPSLDSSSIGTRVLLADADFIPWLAHA